ncbi:MAG TPA: HD domain-containing phosphohydrolase [Actinomycetes bacterium]|nr:HD domain-containing phosphohydrolase [Actinomycetes bacterium]
MGPRPEGVRVAELVATLSYAADLGLGQPMAHCMRQTVIALRLADLLGADAADREATFYLGLLMNAYCHADAAEQAEWFGDDIGLKGDLFEAFDMTTAQFVPFMLRRVAARGSGLERARRVAVASVVGKRTAMTFLTTHATLGSQFAMRIGLGEASASAIGQGYEQWDGRGLPRGLKGEQICLPARLVPFASPVEVFSRRHGVEAARSIARRRRGTQFDARVVDAFCDHAEEVLADLDNAADWDVVLADKPFLDRRVDGAELDELLEAMADLVDMKSPHLAGHSRGVANLAAAAARVSGGSDDEVTTVRRAGLIHDLGRLGVSNAIWDKPALLGGTERDRVQLHPHLTERMLARVDALTASRTIAARHHERLDGSGYPRGLGAAALSPQDRLLAAADVYHAMTEPRPYRPPASADHAARVLQSEVRDGRLDGEAVNAVLAAAGRRAPARRQWPGGLTAREVEVLQLVARGQSDKQVARRLGVTHKTASNHVQHIYVKLGVSSRAAATLWATQHGLMGQFETD